ncbi:A disintegrin and metalloproteinase with thrombospondin motifs 20 isoform X2 [Teleopsis dalmanni]|nr:A disintegrin and metalloproteinase with thrombospondin motifs 20 isoform X2 [Teleopsis dalmanni]XP_037955486.1 A disintegrin and metalloproteinase with thrombospondin motifs 20 isoform X2 [Teleopsis dalmanni]
MSEQKNISRYIKAACIVALVCFLVYVFILPGSKTKNDKQILRKIQPDYSEINYSDFMNHSLISDVDWTNEDIENDIDEINNSIPDNFISDYVTLTKVDNVGLNADDMLYESKRKHNYNKNLKTKDNYSAFSKTGTFRSKSSQIWDPHPEYIFNAFGRKFHMLLHQDTSFIPPKTFRVIRILNNRTEEEEEGEEHYLGCYYKGVIQDDIQSTVAVSLCHGMTGYIKTSFGTLLIQPVNQTNDDSADIVHKVWRHSSRNGRHAVSGNLDMDLGVLEQHINKTRLRKKRNYVDRNLFTMEVLIAVDRSMNEFHKEDLHSYILTLISIVSNIFSDASIGNSIYISVAKILIIQDDLMRMKTTSASALLKSFCHFLSNGKYHYDTAMLITRNQICRNERAAMCDTLGLAELGTVCKRHSCSIVQDNGLPAAFTIAHELGHILNMPHDDDDRCKMFNKLGTKRKHIMSSVMGKDIHPWSWSDCSRYYVSEFLEKEDTSCLEDTRTVSIKNYNTKLPGEIYSLDQQCQLIDGRDYVFTNRGDECKQLWCIFKGSYYSSNLPWADGTPCRNNRYWCQKGECVSREGNTLQVVNGGWGHWSSFTPCSLTCGGGVQESQRECNNPLPRNGGKYCAGSRKKYRSCNAQSCPPGSMDSREQQCYDMNGRDLSIKGVRTPAKWIPKYGLSLKDKCKLFCRLEDNSAYFQLSDKVKDGTTCSFDSFDKCVNGICRPAGCDNELNSLAKLDKCGVCEGNNDTCEDYTGNFYVSDLHKLQPKKNSHFYYVTTIPKGASNIVVTQPEDQNMTYIVLRDDEGNSLLSGNSVIPTYRIVSFYAGVTIEYNGSANKVERVNTTYSLKLKRDLIVEIISILTNAELSNDSLLVTYTYTMEKPRYSEPQVEIYRWEMQQWSNCDALCEGRQHRLPVCISTTVALKVAPQYCDEISKPATEYRNCNSDCVLNLNLTSISECSATCGIRGTRERIYHCIQTFTDINRSNIVDLSFCKSKYEVIQHEPCHEGCWNYTDWTTCSKSCGSGSQTRNVACFLNETRVNDTLCNPIKKKWNDALIKSCNPQRCPDYEEYATHSSLVPIYWRYSEWGPCNEQCEKNRTVICINPSGCPEDKRPFSRRKCCNIKYVSNWSKCSVDCGNGTRVKEMHCARVYRPDVKGDQRKRIIIDNSYCKSLRKPTPKRRTKPCKVSCKWSTSNWTQCPADCSEEYQSRSVYCESSLGNPITYKYCDATKRPPSKKMCNNCIRKELKIISKCNCQGIRRRRNLCYDSSKRRIQCPTKENIFKEKCKPPRECLPKSCEEIRRFYQIYQDGEYEIFVNSLSKQIYCYDMRNSPKEYVTVNPNENYSIYYGYKTSDPDTCPPLSRHREHRDTNINSGRTTFHKIRVNITDLRVIENDFIFANTIGTQQAFGSAGDCYNRNMECPQGDFSINLEHTGFRIRPGTKWDRFGNSVIMKESNLFEKSLTMRRALCGGYCGRCSISQRYGLYLSV